MPPMKSAANILLALLLMFSTGLAMANENQLQFTVVGVRGEAFVNVLGTLKNHQGLLSYPLSEEEIHRFYESAPSAIEKALQPYGFFDPVITSTIEEKNQMWTTHFEITPGPQMLVTALDVQISGEGQSDPEFIKLLQNFPVKIQSPLNIDFYNQAKENLFRIASTRGYFTAKITLSRVIINLKTYQAKIILHFETGKRFRFGATTFNETPFADDFLDRFLTYHEGEYYDYTKLQKAQQYFVTSNFFKQTLVTPVLDEKDQETIPVNIHLMPQKSEQVTYGVGYGSDTGARGTFGLNLRRLNRYGHHMNFLGQLSSSGNHLATVNYYIPGKNPARNLYVISGGIGHIDIDNPGGDIISTNEKLSIGYSTYLGEIQQTVALTYLNERYILPAFNLPYINSQVLYPSVIWQFISRDKTFEPTEGFSAYSIISYAPWRDVTSIQFFQARLRVRGLITLFRNTRLVMRGDLGHTEINNLSQLPLSLQLLAGGVNSIRGFNFDSIGPGRDMIIGSFEIQQRIKGNWYLGAFIDAGTVFSGGWYAGSGPALIWASPVGTIEASVARSVNPREKGWHFDFSMGQDL